MNDSQPCILLAERYLEQKHRAKAIFGEMLSNGPAIQLLVSSYVAEQRGSMFSVSQACASTGLPASTALRWLDRLGERALLENVGDHRDERRRLVRLTPAAVTQVEAFLEALRQDL